MRNFKKAGVLMMIYLLLMSITPINALATVQAKASIPQYLKTNDKYVYTAVQYKDKVLYEGHQKGNNGYIDAKIYTYVNQNGKEKNLGEYHLVSSAYSKKYGKKGNAILLSRKDGERYNYNLETGKLDKVTEVTYYDELLFKTDQYNENEAKIVYVPQGNKYYLQIGSTSKTEIERCSYATGNNYIAGYVYANKTLYCLISNSNNDSSMLVKYELKNNKFVEDKLVKNINMKGYIHYSIKLDNNNKIWFLQKEGTKTYVMKVENNSAVKKYEVSNIMNELTVYDDNNLTVWNRSKMKYTSINKTVTTTYVDMPVKTTIYKSGNSVTNITSNLVQNKENRITVTNCGVYNTNKICLNNFAAIRSGQGSVTVKCSYTPSVNIPFKSFDAALLKTAKNVEVVEKFKLVYVTENNKKVAKNAFEVSILYTDTKGKATSKYYATKVF